MEYMTGGIGAAVEGFIAPLIAFFTLPYVGGLLTAGILTAAAVILVWTIAWFVRARRQIGRAITAVGRAAGSTENERRAAFVREYGAIDAELDKLSKIRACWREFRETLERPDLDDPDGAMGGATFVRNEKRPQAYFTLSNAGLSASVLRSWPGILVGVGLVLTFVGLIAALGVAANGLNDPDMDQAQMTVVLRQLLGTAGAKFYASATALGCSIVLGFVQRLLLSRLSGRMKVLNDLLEERLQFDAMASTSRQQLAVLREQSEQAKRFNQDFALKIGDAVRDAFQTNNADLVRGLDAVANKLDALADKTSTNISQTVGDRLDAALSETLSKMDTTLRDVGGSLGRLPEQIGEAVDALSRASIDMGKTMRAGADENARLAGERMEERLSGVVEALNGTVGALQASGEAIGEHGERAARTAAEGLSEAGRRAMAEFSSEGEAVAQSLRGIVEPLREAVKTLRMGSSELGTQTRALSGGVDRLRDALREGETAHRGVAESLGEAASTSARVAGDARALITALNDAASKLGATGEAISDGAEDLHDALEAIKEQARTEREDLERGRERFLAATEQARADLERHVGRYDGVDDEFAKVVARFNEEMVSQQQKLTEHVAAIDHRFAGAIDALSDAIDELSDTMGQRPREAAE